MAEDLNPKEEPKDFAVSHKLDVVWSENHVTYSLKNVPNSPQISLDIHGSGDSTVPATFGYLYYYTGLGRVGPRTYTPGIYQVAQVTNGVITGIEKLPESLIKSKLVKELHSRKAKQKEFPVPPSNVDLSTTSMKKETLAPELLKSGITAMEQRAALRDSPEGERSMAKTVAMFNAYLGKETLTVEDGWAFMIMLKMIRAQNGNFHADDYVDMASYSALW